ncbi:MAG: DsrE family protein [Chloroflexota bacterium]
MSTSPSIVVVFTCDGMGSTSAEELRHRLAGNFLRLLAQAEPRPRVICFYTDGVKLACEGSPVLEALQALEADGVTLVLCSTCLDYFGLREKVRVGVVGGLPDILTAMWAADKVITV